METRWAYTNSYDFPALREASQGVCLIPMGCLEKHGLHLPIGTDILKGSRLAYLASQIETACVFPDLVLMQSVQRALFAWMSERKCCYWRSYAMKLLPMGFIKY